MKKKQKKSWSHQNPIFYTILLSLLLRTCLDTTYFLLISKKFGANYVASEFTLHSYVESYVLTALIACTPPSFIRDSEPGRLVIYFGLVFLVIPMLSLYGCGNVLSSSIFVYLLLSAFLFLTLWYSYLPKFRVKRLSHTFLEAYLFLSIATFFYVFLSLITQNGLNLNWNFYKVYEVRKELVISSIPFMRYLLSWCANVTSQALIAFSLYRRSYFVLGVLLSLQVLLYGITNFKSFLLAPILVILVFFITSGKRNALYSLLIVCIACVVSSMLLYYTTQDIIFPSVFARRLFLTPTIIHFWYYDFFSSNPHTLLSNSILSHFIDYPYEVSVKEIIALEYTGRDISPNVGYLGDAYAHFGFVGMLLFSAILGLILKLIDSLSKNMSPQLSTAMLTMPAFSLINSGLLTTLMTHGLILGILSIWTFNREYER